MELLLYLVVGNLFFLYFGAYFLLNLVFLGVFLVDFLPRRFQEPRLDTWPPVSVLVPAYNEARVILHTVQALLSLPYPRLQVVVVDDGSTDDTLQVLHRAFPLEPVAPPGPAPLPTEPVQGIWRHRQDPRLWVVAKANGGKADALNAGLNLATGDIVVTVDADTLLPPRSLPRLVAPFVQERVAAVGGLLTVANDARWQGTRPLEAPLPKKPVVLFQLIEYLVSYTVGRTALSRWNALLILSGAFSAFDRRLLLQVGGFLSLQAHGRRTVCEDMEVVVRLQRYLREHRIPRAIRFLLYPVAWTEVPARWRDVLRQRNRWHRGLGESLWLHRDLLFEPRYGTLGLFATPYYLLFEFLAPLMKVLALAVVVLLLVRGLVHTPFALTLLVLALTLQGFTTALLTTLVEHRYQQVSPDNLEALRYRSLGDWLRLVAFSFLLEPVFGTFRLVGQIWGLWDFLRGQSSWYKYAREGLMPQGETP